MRERKSCAEDRKTERGKKSPTTNSGVVDGCSVASIINIPAAYFLLKHAQTQSNRTRPRIYHVYLTHTINELRPPRIQILTKAAFLVAANSSFARARHFLSWGRPGARTLGVHVKGRAHASLSRALSPSPANVCTFPH